MKITEQEVRYVAGLANLNLGDAEVQQLRVDLDAILEHIDKLNEADTEGVEPMSQVLIASDTAIAMRDDEERAPLGNDLALANAPQPGAGHFKVPKVIER